ncbi:MAG: AGE family epimerase/isomerase [Oscillospiraceae bacterium]|nr:AGE family epimerase/isomerase [Oscillospiraceae bacterium]
MNKHEIRALLGFYRNELTNNLLSFWLPRCADEKNGGFFNCYDNFGKNLISRDKYTWSQGRFVWTFAKLSEMDGGTFTESERAHFLALAKQGYEFLRDHVLLSPDDLRCSFLMDEEGNHKYVDGCTELDMSIYADCFVMLGASRYAVAAGDADAWNFAKKLYQSILDRYETGKYNTLPYPLSPIYKMHGKPMMLTHLACEMCRAAMMLEPEAKDKFLQDARRSSDEIFNHFVDENCILREVLYSDYSEIPNLFGQHINPGHTIEDMWFQLDAADLLGDAPRAKRAAEVARYALKNAWDEAYGGYFRFAGINGGELSGDPGECADEPQMKDVMKTWDTKLWWPHSEALYTSLLMYDRTGDEEFFELYKRAEEYVFTKFPNPDRNIREWVQNLNREGNPLTTTVVLPLKDPYHIMRNVALIIELLEDMLRRTNQ